VSGFFYRDKFAFSRTTPYVAFLFSFILIASCTDTIDPSNPAPKVYNSSKTLCSRTTLLTTSEAFLTALLKDDVETALSFYAQNYRSRGDGHGIEYTFFPHRNPNAVYDIIQKNSESEIFVEDLGVFQNGYLVGFFQQNARGQTTNIEYLSQNHWDSFVSCNFVCTNKAWKISEYTCFEDSGSPFE